MKKFRPDVLVQAGLLKVKEDGGRPYDVFRNRLMFPIRDEAGRVIAFGGRVLPGNDSPAKYLNSPETPLFSKSKVAYGLDLARPKVVETKTVAIVEGYTDVVMAHQFGASNVVATLGTAMTEQHVNLLRRFAGRIVLLFDGDAAGDLAVQRALELFLTQPIDIGIATLPDGVDPDEFLLQHGTAAFDEMLAGGEDALSFQWKRMTRQFKANDDLTAQARTIEDFLGQVAAARGSGPVDPIRWGGILVRLSHLTKLPVDDLNRRFKMAPNGPEYALPPAPPPQFGQNRDGKAFGKKPFPNKQFQGKPPFPNKSFNPNQRNDRPFPPRQAFSGPPVEKPPAVKKSLTSPLSVSQDRRLAERWILGGLLNKPSAWQQVQQSISASDFMSPELRPLAEWYWDYQGNEGEPTLADVIAILESKALKTLAIELASEADRMNNPKTLADGVGFICKARQRQADTKLFGQLRRSTEELGEEKEVDILRKALDAAKFRSTAS